MTDVTLIQYGAYLAAFLVAFAIGSLPFALWVARARGIDIRQTGSGNVGATNVYRTLGPGPGVLTFLLDMGKGMAAVLVAPFVVRAIAPGLELHEADGIVGALGAALGHIFSPWVGFKGGKGAATSAGAMLAVVPRAAALSLLCFLIAALWSKRISVGSLAAAVTLPIFVWLVPFTRVPPFTASLVTVVCLLIILRHVPNIRRLIAGTEPVFQLRRDPGEKEP